MSGYVPDGNVHTNSGIPNHAFYIAARGWLRLEKAGKIRALQMLHADARFRDAAQATIDAAALVSGVGSKEQSTVQNAWKQVKVL